MFSGGPGRPAINAASLAHRALSFNSTGDIFADTRPRYLLEPHGHTVGGTRVATRADIGCNWVGISETAEVAVPAVGDLRGVQDV